VLARSVIKPLATRDGESLDQFIFNVNKLIINPLILLLFALALVFFLYGVFEFILSGMKKKSNHNFTE
jgi:hypothetical protein